VVNRVEEKRYPPYVMLNPGSSVVGGEVAPDEGTRDDIPIVEPLRDPDPEGLAADPGTEDPQRRAAERQAVVDRATAEWEAAEQAAAEDPRAPLPAEEVVEQYVEE
jgi:hypothetical protein